MSNWLNSSMCGCLLSSTCSSKHHSLRSSMPPALLDCKHTARCTAGAGRTASRALEKVLNASCCMQPRSRVSLLGVFNDKALALAPSAALAVAVAVAVAIALAAAHRSGQPRALCSHAVLCPLLQSMSTLTSGGRCHAHPIARMRRPHTASRCKAMMTSTCTELVDSNPKLPSRHPNFTTDVLQSLTSNHRRPLEHHRRFGLAATHRKATLNCFKQPHHSCHPRLASEHYADQRRCSASAPCSCVELRSPNRVYLLGSRLHPLYRCR